MQTLLHLHPNVLRPPVASAKEQHPQKSLERFQSSPAGPQPKPLLQAPNPSNHPQHGASKASQPLAETKMKESPASELQRGCPLPSFQGRSATSSARRPCPTSSGQLHPATPLPEMPTPGSSHPH